LGVFFQESTSSRNEIKQHVEAVWEEGYTGKNVTVVVIDNGVRGSHREFANRYVGYQY
jgi:subtilisin family serine protease